MMNVLSQKTRKGIRLRLRVVSHEACGKCGRRFDEHFVVFTGEPLGTDEPVVWECPQSETP